MTKGSILWLSATLVALACNDTAVAPQARLRPILADRFDNAEWSQPVNLGPVGRETTTSTSRIEPTARTTSAGKSPNALGQT